MVDVLPERTLKGCRVATSHIAIGDDAQLVRIAGGDALNGRQAGQLPVELDCPADDLCCGALASLLEPVQELSDERGPVGPKADFRVDLSNRELDLHHAKSGAGTGRDAILAHFNPFHNVRTCDSGNIYTTQYPVQELVSYDTYSNISIVICQ